MRPFRTAMERPAWFIWSSLLLPSLILFCSPTGHLCFLPRVLCLCAPQDTPAVLPQWQQTDVWCHFGKVKGGWGGGGGGQEVHTCKWMRSCTTLGVSISSVICKAPEENSTSRKKHAYRSISCASLGAGGCAVAAGVTGSPSPQLTNKYNQLSWDPSCCCHSHYSWTNTYIKQSEGHWLLADTRTHYIATHVAATYLTHARRYVHTRFHALSTLIAAASTHISYQRNRPFHPPRHVDQNNHIISKLRSATHI